MTNARAPIPRVAVMPFYTLAINGKRKMEHGVYTKKFEAATRAGVLVAQRLFTEDQIEVRRVWVSK